MARRAIIALLSAAVIYLPNMALVKWVGVRRALRRNVTCRASCAVSLQVACSRVQSIV